MSGHAFSGARLARMREVMEGYVERGEVPGMVTLVSRRDETHVNALGALAVDSAAPMDRTAIFRISSMTKPVAAVAAMILVEECHMRLDDPVERWLPELAGRRVLKRLDSPIDETVPAERPITVRDLLTFRLGFGQMLALPDAYPILRAAVDLGIGMGPPTPALLPEPDEWLRRFASLPLMYQPGEVWLYNTGADLLGVLIARVAGKPLETFMAERIFEPLGMKDTGFSVPAGTLDRLATSYGVNPETGRLQVYDPAIAGQWSAPPAFPSAGAGLVSTVDDFFAFGRMMLNGGKLDGERILSRASVELMTADHLTPAQKAVSGLVPGYFESHGWGFGMAVVTRRTGVAFSAGTYGWDGGMGTSWYVDPREELIGILLTQRMWTSPSQPDVCVDFWTSTYQAIEGL